MNKYNKTILKNQLKQMKNLIGKTPTSRDWRNNYKKHKFADYSTIQKYFGSWNNALTQTFNKIHINSPEAKQKVSCQQCKKQFLKRTSQIKKHKNHFCSHACAAIYNNTHKKHGTRKSKLEVWLEIQLPDLYPDLEFHFNRKDAINSELDIYIPKLKLAFELNGIFHYEPIYGQKKLGQIQNNDNRKFQACIEKDIELCIIDTSSQKYFKPKTSQKYLDIIDNIINSKYPV
tara:strand:+ start:964 stop:1656 length:693 start_codon:yes stop_codon:yes gene_type:complete